MPITTGDGTTYNDQQIKDWFHVNKPSDAQVAERAAQLGGLDSSELTNAMTIGRGKAPDPVNSWVDDGSHGYAWDKQGGLIVAPPPAPKKSTPTTSSAALGTPTPWNVTSDQTVEGRINSIINGTVGQQARSQADGEMNSRGLRNSSIAIGAGEDAAFRAAIPIATSDAATYAKAAGYNADQGNQFTVHRADLDQQSNLANLAADVQREATRLNADTTRYTANLDVSSRERIAQFQNTNQVLLNTNQQAAQAFNQAVVAASNINMSTTMDADSKTRAIANIWHDVQNQLTTIGTISGLKLRETLDTRGYPGFDATGNWVGFPPGTPSPAPTDAGTGITTATGTISAGGDAAGSGTGGTAGGGVGGNSNGDSAGVGAGPR